MNIKKNNGLKIICLNRKASFNYFLIDFFEAGLVLRGSEIKSVRNGKVSIADSYGIEKNGEIYLLNSHIPVYKEASYSNHNPIEERKLLLNKKLSRLFLPTKWVKVKTKVNSTLINLLLQIKVI